MCTPLALFCAVDSAQPGCEAETINSNQLYTHSSVTRNHYHVGYDDEQYAQLNTV
jgi:hypothetical protein